eukprot:TRINITY_DN26913_c0_g1_i1.p1 TRINITY_DN26913_c0_g1~~TRINITY_DN26913_c0_g1_i1.p1  ORF type:complete len:801 (+),score=184.69 TRINITY_DN26913_c0_g1_i1:79-2481(+)
MGARSREIHARVYGDSIGKRITRIVRGRCTRQAFRAQRNPWGQFRDGSTHFGVAEMTASGAVLDADACAKKMSRKPSCLRQKATNLTEKDRLTSRMAFLRAKLLAAFAAARARSEFEDSNAPSESGKRLHSQLHLHSLVAKRRAVVVPELTRFGYSIVAQHQKPEEESTLKNEVVQETVVEEVDRDEKEPEVQTQAEEKVENEVEVIGDESEGCVDLEDADDVEMLGSPMLANVMAASACPQIGRLPSFNSSSTVKARRSNPITMARRFKTRLALVRWAMNALADEDLLLPSMATLGRPRLMTLRPNIGVELTMPVLARAVPTVRNFAKPVATECTSGSHVNVTHSEEQGGQTLLKSASRFRRSPPVPLQRSLARGSCEHSNGRECLTQPIDSKKESVALTAPSSLPCPESMVLSSPHAMPTAVAAEQRKKPLTCVSPSLVLESQDAWSKSQQMRSNSVRECNVSSARARFQVKVKEEDFESGHHSWESSCAPFVALSLSQVSGMCPHVSGCGAPLRQVDRPSLQAHAPKKQQKEKKVAEVNADSGDKEERMMEQNDNGNVEGQLLTSTPVVTPPFWLRKHIGAEWRRSEKRERSALNSMAKQETQDGSEQDISLKKQARVAKEDEEAAQDENEEVLGNAPKDEDQEDVETPSSSAPLPTPPTRRLPPPSFREATRSVRRLGIQCAALSKVEIKGEVEEEEATEDQVQKPHVNMQLRGQVEMRKPKEEVADQGDMKHEDEQLEEAAAAGEETEEEEEEDLGEEKQEVKNELATDSWLFSRKSRAAKTKAFPVQNLACVES